MDNQSKGYSIIAHLIWPFSAFFIGIKNFDSNFGRKLLIALYAFLGFTAISFGDLLRYEAEYYTFKSSSFSKITTELISLQNGKFYNSLVSVISGFIFESHHYYFLILFLVYGFFYINTINMLKEVSLKSLDRFGTIFFFGLFLFLFVRAIPNLAFYTGGVFALYTMVMYYKHNNPKYLALIAFTPLFHIGLTIFLILPFLVLLFKNKTWFYVFFVVLTFGVGKSNVVGFIEDLAQSNTGTIIESKYKGYASEKGQNALEERYEKNSGNYNYKLQSLVYVQDTIWYFFVPLGMALLFIKRKTLLPDDNIKRLFHVTLLFWGISNLMVNISQGLRFLVLFCFIAIGLFFVAYTRPKATEENKFFRIFLNIFVPVLFLFGVMATYASNAMLSIQFFISNYFIEIFNYTFASQP